MWGSKKMWLGLLVVLMVAGVLWGPIVSSRVEQAKYTVVKTEGSIEIRDYASSIVAETRVNKEREEAINDGFRRIADYIFGNNVSNAKLAMTAPVTQEKSEKIAMTAPVTQQAADNDGKGWKVRFIMPAEYTLETLPKPKNPEVYIKAIPETRFAVITFSGIGSDERLKKETETLRAYISNNHYKEASRPSYAFYNPPWTLPFLRRNEVMIQIEE
jgi:hypothetical protein